MSKLPLLFTYRDLIEGNGFFAGVEVYGRGLLVEDEEECWMYGVNPGAVAGGGETRNEALSEFRTRYKSVLFDFAEDAGSFEAFRSEVEAFFHQMNEPFEQEWDEAVDAVRRGEVEADWLIKEPLDVSKLGIRIVLVEEPRAKENVLPKATLAA